MRISECLEKNSVFPELVSTTKPDVLKEISEKVAGAVPRLNVQRLNETLAEREGICSTAIDSGVAIPHVKLLDIPDITIAFARSEAGVDFDSLDGERTHLFAVLITPENCPMETRVKLLARLSRILGQNDLRPKLVASKEASEIYNLLIEEDEKL
ncbi:MAG: PTS sugar transporter subunit IIA [Candidatus Dadabacteria bacterium]|nr:PTS sugar transporter subunit IIA [Candidatus Dadabacteria bacterium]MYC40296.1 PTS sugar transporter subunit IIA [Candidatus Dadabacteria bacterium]MYH39718.1 PTS sugar transporter subunit IIA [Candidatus Dadabacteria bacterium]